MTNALIDEIIWSHRRFPARPEAIQLMNNKPGRNNNKTVKSIGKATRIGTSPVLITGANAAKIAPRETRLAKMNVTSAT